MEDRRRAQRQSTVWMGFCHVEGESPNHVEGQSSRLWRGCGVFDFSTLGVGMDFRHPYPTDLVGRRITVYGVVVKDAKDLGHGFLLLEFRTVL